MVKTILTFLLIGGLVAFIILWVVSGGIPKTIQGATGAPNIVEAITGGDLASLLLFPNKLPWQDEVATNLGADITPYLNGASGDMSGWDVGADGSMDAGNAPIVSGDGSPYRSQIILQDGNASATDPSREHLIIANVSGSAVDISGWTLQSAVSGKRLVIPQAAPAFVSGVINSVEKVTLGAGVSAIVTSGTSPVGVSFRENVCSGYLGQLQSFIPAFDYASCPDLSGALAQGAGVDAACVDYARTIPPCAFPSSVPADLSPACRTALADTLTYNGCVRSYRSSPDFARATWRLYLNAPAELWGNDHDIIRLLDAEGRIVSGITF